MSDDLITSLRALAAARHDDLSVAVDAVIEIERLRADLALEQSRIVLQRGEIEKLRAENERLRFDRRERIATAALQGLLSNSSTSSSPWEIVVAATAYADALIALLDKEPQP